MCYKTAHHSHMGRHGHHRHHARNAWKNWLTQPPVNVEELDDKYEVHLFAAGYAKSDFQIVLQDNTLIIRVDKPENANEGGPNWRRLEFEPKSFERRFELNEKIDKEAISASYEDGILKVTLQKRAGFESVRQEIDIV